jgi:predicted permease
MSLRTQIVRGLRALRRPSAADRDLADEVEHYLAEAAAAYREQGLSDADARRAAQRDLGSRTSVQQQVRTTHWETRVEALLIDLRRAARRLCRSPGFALVTVVTLALGIGASTAIFSTVRPVLLQALPYPNPERVVAIADAGGPGGTPFDVTFGTHREVVARSRTIQWAAVTRAWQPTLIGHGEAERLNGQSVSATYFRVLGVAPAMGRDFSEADDVPGAAPVAIIDDGLWRRRLGGDPGLVGRTITLDGTAVTIVGIMPRTFENVWNAEARIWRPLGYDPSLPVQGREWGHHLQLLARLAPEASLDAAQRELASIARTPVAPFDRPAWASLSRGFSIMPLRDQVTAHAKPALHAVVIATLLLLLIAVVNVVTLMLGRAAERRTELVTCAAFGASRARLLTPLLAEGLLLAVVGGALGVTLAYAMVGALVTFDGLAIPRVEAISVDRTALGFAAGLSACIGVLAGCMPGVLLSSRTEMTGAGPRIIATHQRLRRGFVAAEVALAMVLLVGAGLLVRTVQGLMSVPPGFRPEGVLTLQVQAGMPFRDANAVRQFFDRVREAVHAVPGVASAALTSQLPLSGDSDLFGVGTKTGSVLPADADPSAYRYTVSPGYLETMGIALHRGRTLDEGDQAAGQRVALISMSLADHRFPGRDPIGEQIRIGAADAWFTVVGVVGDVKQSSLAAASRDAIYVTQAQWYFADRAVWVLLRTTVDPATIEADVRRAIQSVDANQPIFRVATMEQRVSASMGRQRFVMAAFDAFAAVALLLATIGIYGVLARGVVERTREIALRSAVGASRGRIVRLIGGQAIGVATLGMIVGGGVAVAMSRSLTALLFAVSPLDALTYAGVAALLLIATSAGTIVPAWRAARIAPAVALQSH